MKFLNKLFSKKTPHPTRRADTTSLNETVEEYQEQVLQKFIRERADRISRLATWEIKELSEAIDDYREELAYCKITEGASMCNIFEEKIYQLNAALEILEKTHLSVPELNLQVN